MHSASFESETSAKDGGEIIVAIAALVTEGRIPGKLSTKTKGFYEGPHCPLNKATREHQCNLADLLVRIRTCVFVDKYLDVALVIRDVLQHCDVYRSWVARVVWAPTLSYYFV